MVLNIIFENIQNTLLVLSENSYCSLNLVLLCSQCFRRKKKLGIKSRSPCFFFFLFLLFLRTENRFQKKNQTNPKIVFFCVLKNCNQEQFSKTGITPCFNHIFCMYTLCDLMSSMSLAIKLEDDIIFGLLVSQSKASFVAISPIPTKAISSYHLLLY